MTTDGFILDRQMVSIIKDICSRRSITVQSFSDDWILELSKGEKKSFVYGYRFGLNNASSEGIAQDKVATYQVLNSAGVQAVPHSIVSTRATSHEEWKTLAQGWGRFVVKPLQGGGGRGLRLFSDIDSAVAHMDTHAELAWCASPFLDIVSETRLILLDDRVLLAFEKTAPHTIHDIPMFNLRLGARASTICPSEEFIGMAQAAQRAVGLTLTAVDIIKTRDGSLKVLELNDAFSLEHFLRQDEQAYEAAAAVYEAIVEDIFPGDTYYSHMIAP